METYYKKYIIILLFILSICCLSVFADDPIVVYNQELYGNSNNYFNEQGSSYQSFLDGGGNLAEISPESLNTNPELFNQIKKAGHESKLTEKQLSLKSNIHQAGDLSKLNQNSMQNSIKKKFNIKMPKVGAGSLINMIGDKLKSLKTNFDGEGNLEINNPLSSSPNDNSIIVKGNSNSKTKYNVETDSKVSLELNDIEIAYIGDTLNEIIDFKHIDKSRESSIDIEKQNDGSYRITTSNLESTFHGNGFNEYVFGEKSDIA